MKNYFSRYHKHLSLIFISSLCLVNGGLVKANVLVEPSPFKGFNGLNFDNSGQLYVTSLVEQTIYNVDIDSGKVEVFIEHPQGQGDDLFWTENGQVFYTALLSGEVRTFDANTEIFETIVSNLPGANPIIQKDDGRVFVAQSLTSEGNGLYEIDPMGLEDPRLSGNYPGFLNAFDFGSDGLLYSPLVLAGEVIKIDVDTGVSELVASGLGTPTSVKFNSSGELFALDNEAGQLLRVDQVTGETEVVVSLSPGLDNMAFSPNDRLYITNSVDSILYEVNTDTKEVRQVIESQGLTSPGGIAAFDNKLYVADTYSYRVLDLETGLIEQTIPNFTSLIQFPLNVSVNENHVLTSSWFAGVVQRLERNTNGVLNSYDGFSVPYDAVELADGRILVADCGLGQVTQILNEAGDLRQVAASNLFCPTGLAVIDQHQVLVTEFLANRLSLINLLTGEISILATDLAQPEGVAYHSDGIAIVAETGQSRLRAIEVTTGQTEILATDLPIGLLGFMGGPPPYGMTGVTLSDNTIYVTGDLDNSIETITLPPNLFKTVPESASPFGLLVFAIGGLGFSFKKNC